MTTIDTASSTTDGQTDLFTVAHDLLSRAAEERQKGNAEAANKLLLAASNIMGDSRAISDGTKAGPPNGTQQVADILKSGWHEVSQIAEATSMSANRIHVIIGRLKGKGRGLETQSVKRYRIVDSK